MVRAFWKGAISFGLVNIPVKMYVASENRSPGFHYLHKKCLTRPKQVLYCEHDNEYITTADVVMGFEYARGQYAVFQDEEFEKVPVRTKHTIDIQSFAKTEEIDPIYFYSSHYLEPEETGVRPFTLLREALIKTGLAGIAKVSFQRREHLVCLRPFENILTLHGMHYRNEIRPRGNITVPKKEIKADEMAMAVSLITAMQHHFKADEYRDEYREALDSMIEAKIQGKEITVPDVPPIEMPDLMSALKASIEAAQKGSKEKTGKTTRIKEPAIK
jgi:DNA end-binding protein Ku